MSKTVAKIASGLIDVVTLPLNARQRGKARAWIAGAINQDFNEIQTKRGVLKLYGGRGSTIASTVSNWERDEPETRYWIENFVQTGDVFWDIGANVGIFSIYANMGGVKPETYAFEPSSLNFALLTEHIALNGMNDRITALPVAFADKTGLETLYFKSSEAGAACNGLGEARNQFSGFDAQYKHGALAFTVDDFIKTYKLKQPDHIKLDVDGIEGLILKGAKKTLKGIKSLIIELEGQNENNAEIESIFKAAGLTYDPALEGMGTGRNKLYIGRKK